LKNFAFIFARGGSKGIPRKNIKSFGGKPLIAHSIEIAKEIEIIDEVFVSTDNNEIKKVAEEFGARIIHRPPGLATDHSPEWLSWKHAIEYLSDEGLFFDTFISLPATSPLRAKIDVTACIDKLYSSPSFDLIISVSKSARNPYFNMIKKNDSGYSELLIRPKKNINNRQEAPEVFDMTTVCYATSPGYIIDSPGLFYGNVGHVLVPKDRAIDIDDPFDFKIAELIFKNIRNVKE